MNFAAKDIAQKNLRTITKHHIIVLLKYHFKYANVKRLKLYFIMFNLSSLDKQSKRHHTFLLAPFAEIFQTGITLGKGNVNFKFLFQSSYVS